MPSSVIALGSASAKEAGVGEAERQGALGIGLRYAGPALGDRAARDDQHRQDEKDELAQLHERSPRKV
jgi:hypothetical protein